MIAVDTNVVVRILTGDHPGQTEAARLLFDSGTVWVAKTVVLETAWVLSKLYGFDSTAVFSALRKLAGLPNVRIEDEVAVIGAIELASHGMDFGDAAHLSSRPDAAPFYSFDVKLVRRAAQAGAGRVLLAGEDYIAT